jgi:hypothetical protein
MSAHILNIYIDKTNGARMIRLSPHDSGTVNVSRTVRTVHSVEGIAPQMCGNAFGAFEYRMNIVRATNGAQVELK